MMRQSGLLHLTVFLIILIFSVVIVVVVVALVQSYYLIYVTYGHTFNLLLFSIINIDIIIFKNDENKIKEKINWTKIPKFCSVIITFFVW